MPHGKECTLEGFCIGIAYGYKQAANQLQIDETGGSFLGLVAMRASLKYGNCSRHGCDVGIFTTWTNLGLGLYDVDWLCHFSFLVSKR